MTRAEQIAHHRAELARLEAEEKAARPALAAGQVWRNGLDKLNYLCLENGCEDSNLVLVCIPDGILWCGSGFGSQTHSFTFLGLARDVLRVVEPEAVAQPEPEPTGASNPGDGYRLLGMEEPTAIGDQYWNGRDWRDIRAGYGDPAGSDNWHSHDFRRKVAP